MTPRVLEVHIRGFEHKRREIDRQQYYQGVYYYEAVTTALYNAFRNKGKPVVQYRDRPFMEPEETEEERLDKEIRQAILNEELWIQDAHRKGLPETVINV